MSSKPLIKNKLFQVKVDKLNERWVSGMLCGVSCIPPEKVTFPVTALGLKKHSWIICSDWISHNGTKVRSCYGANLENLRAGSIVGLLLDEDSRLHLYIDGVDQGVAASDLPSYVYAVIDLYGQCEQISIIGPTNDSLNMPSVLVDNEMLNNNTDNATASATAIESEDVENSREKADLECHEKESNASNMLDDLADSLVDLDMQDDERNSNEDDVDIAEEITNIVATSTNDNDLASRNLTPSNKGKSFIKTYNNSKQIFFSTTNCVNLSQTSNSHLCQHRHQQRQPQLVATCPWILIFRTQLGLAGILRSPVFLTIVCTAIKMKQHHHPPTTMS